MSNSAQCLFLYLESPLHVGVGEPGVDVDLPILREPVTGHPLIPGSSLKGSLRACAQRQRSAAEVEAAFGSTPDSEERSEGCLIFSDARPLLYPVRSLKGLFAWITSPDVLARWQRDTTIFGLNVAPPVPAPPENAAGLTRDSALLTTQQTIVLEDLSFSGHSLDPVSDLADWLAEQAFPDAAVYDDWRRRLRRGLAVLPDEAFRYFVEQTTPVMTRIRIDPATGTAAEGALWTEEVLPPETLLYALIGAEAPERPAGSRPGADEALDWLQGLTLDDWQLGAGRTLGRGLVQVRWSGGGKG